MLDSALHRSLLAALDKREQRGATGDGTVTVAHLQADEALALDGLLSPRRPILPGRSLRIALSEFEAALHSCGVEPRSAYEQVAGRPVRDLPAERAHRLGRRGEFRGWLLAHPATRAHPGLARWLDGALRRGQVHADLRPLIEQALQILAVLPAEPPLQRTVLSARVIDRDPHALDVGTPLHGLTISMLAAAAELGPRTPARDIWAAWNVLADPVSSTVAVLNLPPLGDPRIDRLADAAREGHLVLTHGQLAAGELRWPREVPCFSCENPSVLIAAEQTRRQSVPPLLCTGGHPSDAARLLLSAVHAAGAPLRHHGDFDEAGVQILRDLQLRYGAEPWRFDLPSLLSAVANVGSPLPDLPPTSLEAAIRELRTAVPEELVIDELLADLKAASTSSGR